MQQIRDAEVLDSLGVTMGPSDFAFSTSNPSALRETIVEVPPSFGPMLGAWGLKEPLIQH